MELISFPRHDIAIIVALICLFYDLGFTFCFPGTAKFVSRLAQAEEISSSFEFTVSGSAMRTCLTEYSLLDFFFSHCIDICSAAPKCHVLAITSIPAELRHFNTPLHASFAITTEVIRQYLM